MKTVTVTVTSDDAKDNTATSVIVETDRGAGYLRTDGKDLVTNKDKETKFNLRAGQRLVIEAYAPEAVAYDREQGASFTPHTQVGTDGKLDDAKNREQNEALKKEKDRLNANPQDRGAQQAVPKPDFSRESQSEDPRPDSVKTPAKTGAGTGQAGSFGSGAPVVPPGTKPSAEGKK